MDNQRTTPATTAAKSPPPAKPTRAAKPRARVRATLDSGKDSVRKSADALKSRAVVALDSGVEAIDNSPLTAIAGALAVGAAAAALIPATRREIDTLGPLGTRARGALDQAFNAAKSAGADQLTTRGLTSAALSTGLGGVIGGIVKAALAASAAAGQEARQSPSPTAPATPV